MNRTVMLCGLIVLLTGTPAGLAGPGPGCPHCEIRCPRCKCCVSEVEIVMVKKPCWEVECEPVCIPSVSFPWELPDCKKGCNWFCCPPAKCGKVRMVHVLKPQEYECQECHYKFTPVCCECDRCAKNGKPAPPDAEKATVPASARQPYQFRLLPRLR